MWLPWALLLLCAPGSLSLRGPSTVSGTVGGSLSLSCQYQEEYKRFAKYWCRQPCLPFFSETVETSASGGEVRSGRVSIMDHPGNLTFTVTLENLTADDAGKYRCGISTILVEDGLPGYLPDPLFQVQVFVFPVSEPGDSCSELAIDTGKVPQAPAWGSTASSNEISSRTPGPPSQDPGSLLNSVHFLLLIFLKVPLFLSMLSAILWVNRPPRAICGQMWSD